MSSALPIAGSRRLADLDAEPLPDKLKVELDRRLDAYVKDPSTALSLEEVRKRMKGPQ